MYLYSPHRALALRTRPTFRANVELALASNTMNSVFTSAFAVVFIGFVSFSRAQEPAGLGTNVPTLQERMTAFETGQMTLEQLTDKREWAGELLDYYKSHTDEVPVKWKLPISRCLAGFGDYAEAEKVATEYVGAYPKDGRGWRIIGGAKLMQKAYGDAIQPLTKAVQLGDDYSYKGLGAAALAVGQTNLLRETVVPNLLRLRDAKNASKDEKLDLGLILVIYSLEANQPEIFVHSLNGLTASDILERGDLPGYVMTGCERFNDKRTKDLCQEIEKSLSKKPKEHQEKSSVR